jgi:hypothetical protein
MIRQEAESGKAANVSAKEHAARMKWAGILRNVFVCEAAGNLHSLKLAEEASQRGEAVFVVSTHFSKTDPVHTILEMTKLMELRKKNFLVPIALHQDKRPYHWLGDRTGVKLMPIVTENTLKREKYKDHKPNEGEKEFFIEIVDAVREGKVIPVSAQAEREPYMKETEKPTMGMIINELEEKGIRNYSVIFVASEIKGIKNYAKKNGMNFFSKHILNIGDCLSREKLFEQAVKIQQDPEIIFSKKRKSLMRCVNHVIYEGLREAAPKSYKENPKKNPISLFPGSQRQEQKRNSENQQT